MHKLYIKPILNGIVNNETKEGFLTSINQMVNRDGIQGIILGCTELTMLIKNEDLNIHPLNTAEIHINKIVDTIFMDKTH